MEYRELGSSGLKVSVISFGAWQLADGAYWGSTDQTRAEAAVHGAIDAGVNLFDTAEGYGDGESERALGRALGSRRKDVLVASKVSEKHLEPTDLRRACEGSLERLGTDVIDLYQVHWPVPEVPFQDTYGELKRLRDEGKIRAIGVSNFGQKDLDTWMAQGQCVSDQLGYNILFRAIEHEIVPACAKHNVGILAYMPLMQGILSGRWKSVEEIPQNRRRTRHFSSAREGVRHGEQGAETLTFDTLRRLQEVADDLGAPLASISLAWVVAQPGVTTVIVGGRNPEQVQRNLGVPDLRLGDETLARLNAVSESLKEHLGTNADMWQGAASSRIR